LVSSNYFHQATAFQLQARKIKPIKVACNIFIKKDVSFPQLVLKDIRFIDNTRKTKTVAVHIQEFL